MSVLPSDIIIPLKRFCSDQLDFRKHGFLIGDRIGCGTFATVKTAVYSKYVDNKQRRIKLACKIIDQNKISIGYLTKFLPRELEILTKIDHPNIIQIHSIFQRKQKIYIFMQNAESGDLFQFIRINGAVKETWAKYWFHQLVSAVQYLHSIQVAHRDLKCENILLSRHMNIKVSDFGFARTCNEGKNNTFELSSTFCGSVAYASPEILMNKPYDAKMSDIWSMGVILFIMLFASMPFDDTNYVSMLNDQRARRLHINKKIDIKLTLGCKKVLRAMLEPALEFRAKLDEIAKSKWLKKHAIPE